MNIFTECNYVTGSTFSFSCVRGKCYFILCADNRNILSDYHKAFQGKRKNCGGTSVHKTCVTLLATCLRWRITKIQVFLVTPLCQHFLVALVMVSLSLKQDRLSNWPLAGLSGKMMLQTTLNLLLQVLSVLHSHRAWFSICSMGTYAFQFYFSLVWWRNKKWKRNTGEKT